MSLCYVDDDEMTAIANAIRSKTGSQLTYKVSQFAIAVGDLRVIQNSISALLNRTITSFQSTVSSTTSIRQYAFAYCHGLIDVNITYATTINNNVFYMCDNLKNVNLPAAKTIGASAFNGCERLSEISLPAATSIGQYAFYSCIRLNSLRLPGSTTCTLANANALDGTPIANGEGYIYVPSNKVSTYKAASGWSTYASRIVAI